MTGFWLKELKPPSSPDLNPMDFAIWSILESKACSSTTQILGSKEQVEGLLGRNFRINRECFMQSSSWQIKMCSESKRRIYWKLNIYSISYVSNCIPCKIFLPSLAYLLSYLNKHLSTLGYLVSSPCIRLTCIRWHDESVHMISMLIVM